MSLVFEHFDVEYHPTCSWDNVAIYESTCNGYASKTTICGVRPAYTYQSGGHVLCVKFTSDHVVTKKGFRALVTALPGT